MFYLPISLFLFFLLLLALPLLWFTLTIEVVQLAAAKLGFSPSMAVLLLLLIILGSTINIPLYRKEAKVNDSDIFFINLYQRQFWGIPFQKVSRSTVVALNVGGGLIPIILALYQFQQTNGWSILLVTAIVTIVSYYAAQVVPGIGIQMNPLLAPLTAALVAVLLSLENVPDWFSTTNPPAVAFASGVLGTVIGADLLHLKDLERMSHGVLSIGGAGVFDGIILCGLFALLLT
jgi:uncharacterized membrane protein